MFGVAESTIGVAELSIGGEGHPQMIEIDTTGCMIRIEFEKYPSTPPPPWGDSWLRGRGCMISQQIDHPPPTPPRTPNKNNDWTCQLFNFIYLSVGAL